jgi:PAS domain S-box-containing protein
MQYPMPPSPEPGNESLELLRLRAVAEQKSEMVLELSSDGRFSYVSPSVESVLGYGSEEFAELDPLAYVHPDDIAAVTADYAKMLSEGERVHSVHRARHKRGHWCWLEDLGCTFIDGDGERRVLILARDVSHQKRLEEELERQLSVQGRVADLSRHFLSLASDAIDEGVERHLSTIAELARADSVRLVVRKRGRAGAGETYDYCVPSVAGSEPGWPGDLAQRYPWLGGRLANGEVVQLHSVHDVPDAARPERHEFRRRGVQSALLIPLWFGRTVIGYQVFETLRAAHHWSLRDVAQLRLVGEIFASAVQRKHSEEFLRASQERFHAIAEHAGELVMELDERACILFLSPSVEQQLGYRASELQGTQAHLLMHEEELPALAQVFDETLDGHSELRVMHRMKHKDGSWRWFETSGRVYQSAAGERRFISIGRDVTDRRAAEREIERQLSVEKRVAALSRRFLALEPEQTDAATEDALRESAALAVATRSFLCVLGPKASEPKWYEWCREGVASFQETTSLPWSTRMFTGGHVIQLSAGDRFPEEAERERRIMRERGTKSALVIPLLSEHGPVGMIGFESHDEERHWSDADVTLLRLIGEILISAVQRARTEQALRESQAHLLHAERLQAVGRLAGGIAHDFNNLLTVILGFSRPLMAELAEGDPVREDIVEIHGAAERAAALTRQLLTFSRRQEVDEQLVDWNEVLQGLESLLARLLGGDVELVLELDPELGTVRGDPYQFEQVAVNLAANARDAMPDGGTLHITTRSSRLGADEARRVGLDRAGEYVQLEVRDQGHGLDEETRAHIFDPFFTTKDPGKGTGLGLSITYGVVEQAGGAIQVESEANKGTVFRIWIPCTGPRVERDESLDTDTLESGSGCVLLVEDERAVRRLMRRMLERDGYRVLEASDGVEALAVAEQQNAAIDALVTDVKMPRLGGHELATRLRALHPRLAILFMSGYPGGDEAALFGGQDAGLAVLQKPFASATLLSLLREALEEAASID